MVYQLEQGKLEVTTDKNAQRLEDCILILLAGRSEIGPLAAMIATKAIIEKALEEHRAWQQDPAIAERNKKIDQILEQELYPKSEVIE